MNFTDYIISRGAYILPASIDGKPKFKDIPENRITDRERLLYYYKHGFKRFIHRPYSAGLIGIDIDVKNGRNGWKSLQEIYKYDLKNQFHVMTPSGGLHLYFTVDRTPYISCEVLRGVEVKSKAFLTIPGSVSAKGDYIPVGDPESISGLPGELHKIIPVRNDNPAPVYTPRTGDNISLNKIYEVLCRQGLTPTNGARNQFCFQFSRYAKKENKQPDEVQNYLSFLISSDFSQREIQACVNSAFRGCNNCR
jgi:hypothetical protein